MLGEAVELKIDLEMAKLHTAGLAMVGKTSISGIQRKISVDLDREKNTLRFRAEGGAFILKPPSETFPDLPEIEHLSMCIAMAAGLEVPDCGLVEMKDGRLAYLVRRFDRRIDGSKVHQEDFCQLAELPPKDKYEGSAERCAKIVRRYCTEPGIQLRELFRQFVVAWCLGNGDLHLKNLSLIRDEEGRYRLSPVYDMLSTVLLIQGDQQALTVQGKRDNLDGRVWLRFAESIGFPKKAARRVLNETRASLPVSVALVERSFLPEHQKSPMIALIRGRMNDLECGEYG